MTREKFQASDFGCGCDCGCDRREFLATSGATAALGSLSLLPVSTTAAAADATGKRKKEPARIRVVFIYPSSDTFRKPGGWWSWPGNDFDAEGRQKEYTAKFKTWEKELDVQFLFTPTNIGDAAGAKKVAKEITAEKPDGVLLVVFYNRGMSLADSLLATAAKLEIPSICYVGLGVKHGSVTKYRRKGLCFIQSLDNFDALEGAVRMVAARKKMSQTRLLSIIDDNNAREGTEPFFKVKLRITPFQEYATRFDKIKPGGKNWNLGKELIDEYTSKAQKQLGITPESLNNAARAYLALREMLDEHDADGVTMNCLKRGMLKPCIAFSKLNGSLIPATCEDDRNALYTQLLGQLLTGKPGFQHNSAYETESNLYYASHCTCPKDLKGPGGETSPYLLRRFAHTNEGSCAIQVFYPEDEPVTIVRYYAGATPKLDVYAGRTVVSHEMPPVGGCTTNVVVKITDRKDAIQVVGHHDVLFCGDYARRFRMFANLYSLEMAETGYDGLWP